MVESEIHECISGASVHGCRSFSSGLRSWGQWWWLREKSRLCSFIQVLGLPGGWGGRKGARPERWQPFRPEPAPHRLPELSQSLLNQDSRMLTQEQLALMKPQLCTHWKTLGELSKTWHWWALWLFGASWLNFLGLTFPICEMGIRLHTKSPGSTEEMNALKFPNWISFQHMFAGYFRLCLRHWEDELHRVKLRGPQLRSRDCASLSQIVFWGKPVS